jgi:ABC-type lipoprotein export system ATPase subunit
MSASSYLWVRNLGKIFHAPSAEAYEILREVSFTAELGGTVALTGASGAGKSTLLHLLAGLERADRGEVQAGGFCVTNAKAETLAAWRAGEVGLVFQAHRLLPDLDVGENVALPLLVRRANSQEARRQAQEALAAVGLSACARQNVGRLSGGEQQRVALARALVTRPRLLLADEPTGQLDDATGAAVVELMRDYARKQNALLILATHNEKRARHCHRRLHLSDGNLAELS